MEVILDLGLLVSLLVIAFIDNIIFVFFTPHRPIILSNWYSLLTQKITVIRTKKKTHKLNPPPTQMHLYQLPPFPVAHAKITQQTQAPHKVLCTVLYKAATSTDIRCPLTSSYKPYNIVIASPADIVHNRRFTYWKYKEDMWLSTTLKIYTDSPTVNIHNNKHT
jgi:hypothetical protein